MFCGQYILQRWSNLRDFRDDCQKQPLDVFYKKAVPKNFAMLIIKHLCWRPVFNKVGGFQVCSFIKKKLQRRYFPMNIAKFFRTSILKNICKRLPLDCKSLKSLLPHEISPFKRIRYFFMC